MTVLTNAVSIVLLLLLSCTSVSAHHAEKEPSDGTVKSFRSIDPPLKVPAISMLKDGVDVVDMTAFEGKIVLLNLWATWCPPCVRELPALDRLQQRLGDEHFVVVAVAVDEESADKAKEYYRRLDIKHLDLYLATAENVGQSYPIDVFPASFFLDGEGRVHSYLRSLADWDAPEADQLVNFYKLQAVKLSDQ
ncbi:MAG: TlpA family protein disulfide reductase [Motiliproteus sp.]|nr:TlpA family protein disulfide reductase [Motiliproteus sp.]MCW9050750.1 TlpA family protein disulfide reductase [Motiliproteus sp.]